MKALLIHKRWLDLILSGRKTWELRSTSTRIRGPVALVEAGSGEVVGVCEIVGVAGPLSLAELKENARKRLGISPSEIDPARLYRKTHAWELEGARRLKARVPYDHPSGAVIWVSLPESVASKIRRA